MAALQEFDQTETERILDAIATDGGCIAHNVLSKTFCDQLIADFDPHLEAMDWGIDELGYRNEFYGNQTKRLHGLFSKSPHMTDVLTHELFLTLANQLFVATDISRDIRLSNTELMVLNSDQPVQMFHTDAGSWSRIQRSEANEILISANCALTDFRHSNGATLVVPGSHTWAADRTPDSDEIAHAEMPKGSALLYTGNLMHAGGANTETERRIGLYLGYIVSWLRPIENQLVTNNPSDIMQLPEDAQRLLDVSPGGFTVMA